ncbi:MAG TPA: patatin-like phospholipase family protein [Anaeromyxobacteraceae bacterium]|jgi:predicted acylesterase/phospholipase RssA|nr:patatin-like phospholipase family protein [Anaeromyxobacteraceae bacterium]
MAIGPPAGQPTPTAPRAAALLLAALVAIAPRPAAAAGDPRPEDELAFTISGGASLGAYEAGLAWTLTRYLQLTRAAPPDARTSFRPRLAAVAGASAGALNGLLTAAMWCERPGGPSESVDGNLLQETWLHLDLDDLLPAAAERYGPRDGLLASEALDRTARRVRDALFSSASPGRFAPGCRVPYGLTLTRVDPEQREAGGLRASGQRFLLSWQLEADASGVLRVRRHPLPPERESSQSVLELAQLPAGEGAEGWLAPDAVAEAVAASAALPALFGPRPLCECAVSCPAEGQVSASACAAPGARPDARPMCPLAPGAAAPPQLCRRDYVDGGVFDNAPIGLTIDLVEGGGAPRPLHPISYFFVDPDRRRLEPAEAAPREAAGHPAGAAADVRLFGELVRTARSAELRRAVRVQGWNRTTRRLLRRASLTLAQFAELHDELAALGSPAGALAPRSPPADDAPAGPGALGRGLSACLDRMAREPWAAATGRSCAAAIAGRAEPGPAAGYLGPDEAMQLAERLDRVLRRHGGAQDLRGQEELLRHQALVLTSVRAGTTALLVLAGEIDRVAASGAGDERLRRFQLAVLAPVRGSRPLVDLTAQVLDAVLQAQLGGLAAEAGGELAREAARQRRAVAALPYGRLFRAEPLERLFLLASAALSRAEPDAPVVARWRQVEHLLRLRARLEQLAGVSAELAGEAAALEEGTAPERRLVVASRFAPLAGAQLGGLGGFLDEPLRRYDYYAGVYEALHLVAGAVCAGQQPEETTRAAPAWREDDPSELDLSSAQTQRCVGAAMGAALQVVGVPRAPRALRVVAALARLELDASLGSRARAEVVRAGESWAWAAPAPASGPGDPVAATLAALTSRRAPCRAGGEPLCLADLGFGDFLDALSAQGYQPRSESMRLALDDLDLWSSRSLQRLADRALAIAATEPRREDDPLAKPVQMGLGAVELLTRASAERGPAPRLQLDPSTVPAWGAAGQERWKLLAAHLAPYRLELDVARGGVGLAWLEPALRLPGGISLESLVEPVEYRREARRGASALGLMAAVRAGYVSLGLGPRWTLDWSGGGRPLGFQARVSVLQDRVGLAVGLRDLSAGRAERDGWFVALSLSDLNGLLYWLTPRGGPSPGN